MPPRFRLHIGPASISVPPPYRSREFPQSLHDSHDNARLPGADTSSQEKRPLDFTQRIERKLAEYNSSQNVCKRWLFEILGWITSALCMGAVVGVYVHVQDESMAKIARGNLLTYANALGKVASAALIVPTLEALGQLKWNWFHKSNAMWDLEIFDKASRGPWGAAMLLFRTRGRSLAALSALLVVLLLAIDTFFQQVVDFPDRWALLETPSKIPRSTWYQPTYGNIYRDGVQMNVENSDVQIVVDRFAYGNGTQPVSVGNGTRPEIPLDTLGVCSQCEDISSHLTYACLNGTIDWPASLDGGYNAKDQYIKGSMCGYFLNATSQHPVLMSGHLVNKDGSIGETLLTRALPLTTTFDFWPLYGNGSIHFKQLRNTIADVLIVSAANGSAVSVHEKKPPVAQECVLSWCVKTMRSSYLMGKYTEEVVETFQSTTEGPFPWISTPYIDSSSNGTNNFYLKNITISMETTARNPNIMTYGTSNFRAAFVVQAFQDIFPASTTWTNVSSPPIMRYKTWNKGPAWNRILDFNPWLAPNNVSHHMERFATAMTNVIRSDLRGWPVDGFAFEKETFIRIHWEWLTFPFILLILSLIFLIPTIVKTSGDGAKLWKTSTLPTLIYSLPKESQSQFAASETWSSGKGAPRKTRIKLLPNMGWRVSGHSQLSRSPRLASGERVRRGWI